MKISAKISIISGILALFVIAVAAVIGFEATKTGWTPGLVLLMALDGLAIIALTALVIMLNRQIARPIQSLGAAVSRITLGDLSQTIPIHSQDEFGELSQNFNEMTAQLTRTHRKLQASTLAAEEGRAQLESSINGLRQGFILTGAKSEVLIANASAVRIIHDVTEDDADVDHAHVTLNELADVLPPDFALMDKIAQTIKKHELAKYPAIPFAGRFINLYMSPVMNEDTAIGCVVLLEDVTEERIMQRSKDEFFSIASHELRTPLTAIKGNASMMLNYYPKAFADPELREMVNDVHTSSIRLIEIVNDFLDTSRLEQGKIQYKFQLFPLDRVIEQVTYEMGAVLKQKGLYLKIEGPARVLDSLPPIYADPDRTKQIIYNFVGNATKFTQKGGVTLIAHVEGDFLRVQIRDTGRGITPEAQELLFRKFQQASASLLTRDTERGTGLGLYISKLLVQGMGGRIGLEESTPGKGTTFFFTLPLTQKAAEAAGVAVTSEHPQVTNAQTGISEPGTATNGAAEVVTAPTESAKTATHSKRKRVLIFEDDPYVQRLYQRLFAFKDYEVELASDGGEGLARAKKFAPNIILLDIMMPKINGLVLLRSLKEDPETKAVPVLVLTNVGETETIEQARRLGATEYLIKADFTPEQLLREVNKHF